MTTRANKHFFKLKPTAYFTALVSMFISNSAVFAVEPVSIKAGAFELTPTLGMSISDTDNLFLTNTDEISSRLFVINPRINAYTESGPNTFDFNAEVINGEYSATSEDDYTDFYLSGDAGLEINRLNSVNLYASFFDTHERRGTGFSQGSNLPDVPDEFDATEYGLSYQFGSGESQGRLVVDAGRYDKEYTNNRTMTTFRDREDTLLGATFYWRVMPRTDLLIQYNTKGIDYVTDPAMVVNGADTLDSDENYLYVGAAWEASAATTGTIKFGYGEKEFDDPDRMDVDGASWEVGIEWQPLTYSTFNIGARRGFGEASGVGNALETKSLSLSWQHEWLERLSSVVSANFNDDDYLGTVRSDDHSEFSAGLIYNFDRWLDIDLTFTSDSRDSNFSLFEYDQNVIKLGIEASL